MDSDLSAEREQLVRASEFFRTGRLKESAAVCRTVIRERPESAQALHLIGLIASKSGKLDDAVKLLSRAAELRPNSVSIRGSLGRTLTEAGKYSEAEEEIRKAIDLEPRSAELCNDLGNACLSQREFSKAAAAYKRALKLRPDFVGALNNLGVILLEVGNVSQAIDFFQQAAKVQPDFFHAHYGLGDALMSVGKSYEAVGSYRKALEIRPDHADACNRLGSALYKAGQNDEAIGAFRRALELKPDFAVAFSNLGNVLHGKEDYNGALSAYKRAIEISPEYTNAYFNLGVLLKDTKYHAETIDSFKAALRLDSEDTAATAHLLGVYGHTCSWTEAERIAPKVDKANALAIKENRDTEETPFANLMRKADPELNYNVARTWCNSISANVAALSRELSFGWSNSGRSKIRLGYLSFDFREHPIAQLSVLICGLHDRSSFEVYAYSYGRDDRSVYRKRIKEACDMFRDISGLSDREAATLICDDAIDILIDMNGHTAGARLEIPAIRPAPVQMTWLGYPGPTGADFFDYLVGDPIVVSREQAQYFARNTITLPHTFMITDNTAEVAASGRTREMAGLPEEQVIFCSFNQSYKIDPVMFYAWMRILKGVPESVLWLMESNPIAEGNIRKEAEIRRVEGDRIVFAEKLPVEEHLERISLADLGLDTRIYSGGTTTVNTLWAGVPVVTLKGATFCAKMSSSILTAAGLQEMITEDIENFVSLAVCLGQDRSRLHGLKEKLTKNNKTHPLFDTPRFVRNLERAYKTVWKAYRNNEQVCDIEIEDKDGDFR